MKALAKFGLVFSLMFMLMTCVTTMGVSKEDNEKAYNQFLIKALGDSNVGIRSSAAQLLGERKVEQAVTPLVKMLEAEKHYAVRITAALALYQIGGDEALKALQHKMKVEKNKTVKHVLAGLIDDMNNLKVVKQ